MATPLTKINLDFPDPFCDSSSQFTSANMEWNGKRVYEALGAYNFKRAVVIYESVGSFDQLNDYEEQAAFCEKQSWSVNSLIMQKRGIDQTVKREWMPYIMDLHRYHSAKYYQEKAKEWIEDRPFKEDTYSFVRCDIIETASMNSHIKCRPLYNPVLIDPMQIASFMAGTR